MQLLKDVAVAAAAGYLGIQVMEQVAVKLYEMQPEEVRKKEYEARPGRPAQVAVNKILGLLNLEVDNRTRSKLELVALYATGVSWVPVYMRLRRKRQMNPVSAGLVTGVSQWLMLGEAFIPALGFSASNLDYPLLTHLRGLVAHPVFGLVVAAVTEAGWKLLRAEPYR